MVTPGWAEGAAWPRAVAALAVGALALPWIAPAASADPVLGVAAGALVGLLAAHGARPETAAAPSPWANDAARTAGAALLPAGLHLAARADLTLSHAVPLALLCGVAVGLARAARPAAVRGGEREAARLAGVCLALLLAGRGLHALPAGPDPRPALTLTLATLVLAHGAWHRPPHARAWARVGAIAGAAALAGVLLPLALAPLHPALVGGALAAVALPLVVPPAPAAGLRVTLHELGPRGADDARWFPTGAGEAEGYRRLGVASTLVAARGTGDARGAVWDGRVPATVTLRVAPEDPAFEGALAGVAVRVLPGGRVPGEPVPTPTAGIGVRHGDVILLVEGSWSRAWEVSLGPAVWGAPAHRPPPDVADFAPLEAP